jgi:hypothetical protein
VLAILIIFGALAGCGAPSSKDSSAPLAGQPPAAEAQGGAANAGGAAAPNGQKDGGSAQQAPARIEPQQRSLIYTGNMSVKVDNVTVAADKAVDIANGSGGAVGGDRRTLDADRSEAELLLRVPSAKFADTLNALAKLGVEQTRSVQTQDVTEALVDLDARLATQRVSVERVRALLAKAQSLGEVTSIESELTRREADLASLEQRKDKLAGQVALSTITVSLRGPAAAAPAGQKPESGFLGGLKSGWSAFGDSIKVVLVVVGWLLPWAVAIGVPVWLLVWLLGCGRRRRTRGAAIAGAIDDAITPRPGEISQPTWKSHRGGRTVSGQG